MPWRLIEFIIIFAIFLVFIGFNLGNKCDINFGFTSLKEVPVFFTAFSSFILGMFCSVPFIISARSRRKAKDDTKPKKGGDKKAEGTPGEIGGNSFSDGGPYGIN